MSAGAAVDVFGSRATRSLTRSAGAWSSSSRGWGFKREFAALWRAQAKQVPRGRAWYLHRFAVTDLNIRLAPFG